MKEIKEIIVVEGQSDKQVLESIIKADILVCNGSAIDGFDKDYLISLAKTRGVIIFTDPDYPGLRIRNEISSYLDVCKHAFIDKSKAIKGKKVGVAEANKEDILEALENVVTFDNYNKGTITANDLYELKIAGLDSKNNKEKIINYYHLGKCNSKTLLKRLNLLGLSRKDLENTINVCK